jgi:hypothetical protein
LNRNAAYNCRVPGIRIGLRAGFAIAEEDFADATIWKSPDGRDVVQSANLKIECFADAPVRKALAEPRHYHCYLMLTEENDFKAATLPDD